MCRILVDCDDVLIDLCSEWIKDLNKKYKTHYTRFDIPDWNLTGMFNAEKDELLKPLTKKGIWKRCKPIEGAATYLKKLFDEGNEIYIVTATDYRNFAYKIEHCLLHYFPFIPTDNIIRCHHKSMIEADFLIDDNINNLLSDKYNGILFSRPHNDCVTEDAIAQHHITKVVSWEECYNEIHRRTQK